MVFLAVVTEAFTYTNQKLSLRLYENHTVPDFGGLWGEFTEVLLRAAHEQAGGSCIPSPLK